MILYLNENGTISAVTPENLVQGSNNGQLIVVGNNISAFTALYAYFQLPNGKKINGGLMTRLDNSYTINNERVNVFILGLDKAITNFYGNLKITIKQTEGGKETNSYIGTFQIAEAAEPSLPEVTQDIEDILEQILDAYGFLQGSKQDIQDEDLETEDKTVVGAINELKEAIEDIGGDVDEKIATHNQSQNAHPYIRGKIEDIEDGTTVVKKAEQDENGVNINTYYQKKNDGGLDTTTKTVVGAINELNSKLQQATTTDYGVVKLATDSDIQTGTDTQKVVSPKQLKSSIDTALTGAIIYQGQWDLDEGLEFFDDKKPIKQGWRWEATGDTITIEGVEISATDFATFNTDVGVDDEIDISMIDITDNTDRVLSVNGQTGDVVIDVEDASSRLLKFSCTAAYSSTFDRIVVSIQQPTLDVFEKYLTSGREYLLEFTIDDYSIDFTKQIAIAGTNSFYSLYIPTKHRLATLVDLRNLLNDKQSGYECLLRIFYNSGLAFDVIPAMSNADVMSLTGAELSYYENTRSLVNGQYAFCNSTSDGYTKGKLYIYENFSWVVVSEPYKYADIDALFPTITDLGV